MLVNLDIPWVILGHSERRALLNESNEVGDLLILKKLLSLYGFEIHGFDILPQSYVCSLLETRLPMHLLKV